MLSGKVLIDCNNFEIPKDFAYPLVKQSLAEKLALEVPKVRIVKAFNTWRKNYLNLHRHR